MKKSGQVTLVLISILFTSYQKMVDHEPFFRIDFFIFTLIAWLVGLQYDIIKYYGKKARANEESYKRLIESLPESVIIHRDFKIIYVNKAAVSMVSALEKEELIGRSIHDFVVSEYNERLRERIRQVKQTNSLYIISNLN